MILLTSSTYLPLHLSLALQKADSVLKAMGHGAVRLHAYEWSTQLTRDHTDGISKAASMNDVPEIVGLDLISITSQLTT